MAARASARVTRAQRAQLLRGIYAILNDGAQTIELAKAVLDAGLRIVQYRAKSGVRAETLRRLRALTQAHDALLILNDDWRNAVAFDCDGVHLGPDDDGFTGLAVVRAAMPERLIGLSCGTREEVLRANGSAADYAGIGSIYATNSKGDAGEPIGAAGLCRLARDCRLPVAAVGGIDAGNLAEIRRTGVAMAAVISAIGGADSPRAAAQRLARLWNDC